MTVVIGAAARNHENVLRAERERRLRENGACPLVDPRVLEDPVGRCNWCGEPLPLTKAGLVSATRRWCSARVPMPGVSPGSPWGVGHGDLWSYQHQWSSARSLALRRAGATYDPGSGRWVAARCDQCAAGPADIPWCVRCGQAWPCRVAVSTPDAHLLVEPLGRTLLHRPYDPVEAELRRAAQPFGWAHGGYWDPPVTVQLEVNHVEPRAGAGYGAGCWNHQTNLQVLCHPCHVAETTRQVNERPVLEALRTGLIDAAEAKRICDNLALPRHLRDRRPIALTPEARARIEEAEVRRAREAANREAGLGHASLWAGVDPTE